MPNGHGSGSLTNRELYEELRNEGASQEKAAAIANAVERGRDPTAEGLGNTADPH